MSRADEAIAQLKEELSSIISAKNKLQEKIEQIQTQIRLIESVSSQNKAANGATQDLLIFKD